MKETFADFHERSRVALSQLNGLPQLRAAVEAEVDAFFKRYPDVERNEVNAGYIAALALDRLSHVADSQSVVPASPAANKKVA